MKKSIILTLFLGIQMFVFAQIKNPVSWTFESKKISNIEYELTFIAKIDEGSYLYSQEIEEGGPIPTKFAFEKAKNYELVGKVVEAKENREVIQDPLFEMELAKFHNKAIFSQKIKVSDTKSPVKVKVTFMSCDGNRCMPPKTIELNIDLAKAK